MEFIAPMLVMITVALVIGSIARAIVVNRRLRENSRTWAEVQGKLIDRFGSADEVVRYLETEAGRQLLDGQASGAANPQGRILDSVHLGLLILSAGVALVASGTMAHEERLVETLRIFGMIGMMVGVGFLVSAAVSWLLIRAWNRRAQRESGESV